MRRLTQDLQVREGGADGRVGEHILPHRVVAILVNLDQPPDRGRKLAVIVWSETGGALTRAFEARPRLVRC